jgi:hypothetical protein
MRCFRGSLNSSGGPVKISPFLSLSKRGFSNEKNPFGKGGSGRFEDDFRCDASSLRAARATRALDLHPGQGLPARGVIFPARF